MGTAALSAEQTRDCLVRVSARMVASRDLLTQADKAIGDGDHGVGMARGFEAVAQKLAGRTFADQQAEEPGLNPSVRLSGSIFTLRSFYISMFAKERSAARPPERAGRKTGAFA